MAFEIDPDKAWQFEAIQKWRHKYGDRGLRLLVHQYIVETVPSRKPKLEREIREILDELSTALAIMP